jgi:hypothetical protein
MGDTWPQSGRCWIVMETLPVCDPWWGADWSGLVVIPGDVIVTACCDECLELINLRELAVRWALERRV